ncbi:hypothetical protein [Haematomicrobium sanguinis]|uniref:hypothetical protein n=1 Tax=Haematomicrobium sanguinis TaxID=479106 RepID=UPI000479A338|nr:hypothetical protein [Haematomicrobium sanguinis]
MATPKSTPSANGLSRRRALGIAGIAAAGGAIGAGSLGVTPALSAPPSAGAMTKAERAFLQRGLRHAVWVAPDTPPRYVPTPAVVEAGGFNMPTFYDPDLYNAPLMNGLKDKTWSLAKAPFAQHILGPLDESRPYFHDAQLQNIQNLFSVCFGDEEYYSDELIQWLPRYFAKLREQAPDALAHTNQWAGQWQDDQIRRYVAALQPDMLTFDSYYYNTTTQRSYPGGSVTPLYNDTWRYRRLALEGSDGKGNNPLVFGQYTLGYRTGTNQALIGPRVLSETEIWLTSMLTWTLGGKWLNLFRWEWAPGDEHWLLNDANGNLTPQYSQYAALNGFMRNLSPYLVRLRTQGAGIVHGQMQSDSGSIVSTPAADIPRWSVETDPDTLLTGLKSVRGADANAGRPTDTVIGTFRPLPGLTKRERSTWIPRPDTPFFMVLNASGFAKNNIEDRFSGGGESQSATHTVQLEFDLRGSNRSPNALRCFSPQDGSVRRVDLERVTSRQYVATHTLAGAMGDLFFWE